jgi:hypothetical protein
MTDNIESRIAVLEQIAATTGTVLTDIRTDLRDFRTDIRTDGWTMGGSRRFCRGPRLDVGRDMVV